MAGEGKEKEEGKGWKEIWRRQKEGWKERHRRGVKKTVRKRKEGKNVPKEDGRT